MGTLHMLRSATDTICESFIYESGGALLVIDGGFETEAETLYEKLTELGGHVDGWFFTHPHDDHFGAFCRLMTDHGDAINVDRVYLNFPDDGLIALNEPDFAEKSRHYLPLIRDIMAKRRIPLTVMRRGDSYIFGDAVMRVLREPDPTIRENFINNSSVVLRLDANGRRVLFLGDLGEEGGRQLLATVAADELRSEFVQMAHHGQNGVGREVYEAIAPKVCLWNTPTWLWDNMGGDGYDSGPFKTVIVRGWMSEMGPKKHYVNMNGPYEIII